MRSKLSVHALSGLVGVVLISSPLQVSPAMAQDECTCVLPASAGAVGAISTASPDVFVAGATSQRPAAPGTPIGAGSVVTTGPGASAGIDLGAGCRFSMAGSMRLQIVPQGGELCVQVIDESVTSSPSGQTGTIAALAAGAGVAISLGLLSSVSK